MFEIGVEDSLWTFYDSNDQVIIKKYFEYGELVKTEFFEDSNLTSEHKHDTRYEIIKNKYLHLAIIFLLIIALVTMLVLNYRRSEQKDIIHLSPLSKIAGTVLLPFFILILAKLISSLIPNSYSYSAFYLEIVGELIIVYLITTPLFLIVFHFIKLRSKLDLELYVLLFSLSVVLTEEWIYLRNLVLN